MESGVQKLKSDRSEMGIQTMQMDMELVKQKEEISLDLIQDLIQ